MIYIFLKNFIELIYITIFIFSSHKKSYNRINPERVMIFVLVLYDLSITIEALYNCSNHVWSCTVVSMFCFVYHLLNLFFFHTSFKMFCRFIFAFIGVGAILFITSIFGCAGARNGCCLSIVSFLILDSFMNLISCDVLISNLVSVTVLSICEVIMLSGARNQP